MSESQFHAVTKAELKRQEYLLKILQEQKARPKIVPPPVAPPVMPAQTAAPKEAIHVQRLAEKVFRGTGEFNVPRLPDGRPVDKFFQDARNSKCVRKGTCQSFVFMPPPSLPCLKKEQGNPPSFPSLAPPRPSPAPSR